MYRHDFSIHLTVAEIYNCWYCFSCSCGSWRFAFSCHDRPCLFSFQNAKRPKFCQKTFFLRNNGWCQQYLLWQNWNNYNEFDDLDSDMGRIRSQNRKGWWNDSIECPWFYAINIFSTFIASFGIDRFSL